MLSKSKRKWKKETKFEWKNIKLVIAEKLSVAQYIINLIALLLPENVIILESDVKWKTGGKNENIIKKVDSSPIGGLSTFSIESKN